jgi:hypothetical protein
MKDDSGAELRRKQAEAEQATFDRKMKLSPLTQSMAADGWEIEYDADVPPKQMAQLYKAQVRLHYGSDDEYNTILGNILKRDKQKNMQINKIALDAVKFAPPIMAATMQESIPGLDEARGNMIQPDFYERLAPYKFGNPTTWNPGIQDSYVNAVTKVCNKLEEEMKLITATPLADFMTWKTQLVSGTNSGDWLYESLDKEQWVNQYIPELMDAARKVGNGSFDKDVDRDWRTKGIFTMFGRTPDRPVHAVAMFEKMIGAKLNYDLTRGVGKDPMKSNIAWMSLDSMLERAGSSMSTVESTIHEDFKRFDSYVGPELNSAVLEGFRQSDFLKSSPENREIFDFLVHDLTTPTWLRIAPHYKAKMRASLYSGTPVTQIHGSIIHMAFIEMLRDEHGFNCTDYMVLSDDGFCTFDGTAEEAQKYVDDTMIPLAEDIGMILNPKKSYVADITRKKVMYNRDGDKIVRHDVGPFLQKFPQVNPDHAFGNVPRLIRSLKGRERDFERESYNMLFQLLPNMRRTERGDRAQIAGWVQDFWRTLEVTAQVRPGYPRAREMIQTITKIYPRFWDKFDKLVSAAEASGDVLFDRATERAGGSSDKGTTRWLVNYLKEARAKGSFPKLVED